MPSSRLSFTPVVPRDGYAVVAGEVDAYSAGELAVWLETVRADGYRQLQLDLSATEFLDSAGLQVLVAQTRTFREDGGKLVLQHPSAPVRRVLTAADVVDELVVVDGASPA